jgi:hypothetical protein
MSNERTDNRAGDEFDARVSETYREIAREQTPQKLDQAVLRAAAKAARPRYSRSIAWTRPAAWAATITLSVALVLELTREPAPQPTASDAVLPASVAEPPSASSTGRRDVTPRLQLEESADLAKRERAPLEAQSFAPSDADMLRQAEDMARPEESQDPVALVPAAKSRLAPAAATFEMSRKTALDNAAVMSDEASACGPDQVADPESWLECIRELEAAGLTTVAEEQRALLAETFPDFDFR